MYQRSKCVLVLWLEQRPLSRGSNMQLERQLYYANYPISFVLVSDNNISCLIVKCLIMILIFYWIIAIISYLQQIGIIYCHMCPDYFRFFPKIFSSKNMFLGVFSSDESGSDIRLTRFCTIWRLCTKKFQLLPRKCQHF